VWPKAYEELGMSMADKYRSYRVFNCPSEEFHATHTWTYENEDVWCWGWTEEDEFYKIINAEWGEIDG
jgi:hypothetical protein